MAILKKVLSGLKISFTEIIILKHRIPGKNN